MSDAVLIAIITGVFGLLGKGLDIFIQQRSKTDEQPKPKGRADIINPTTHGGILNPSTVGFLVLGVAIGLGVVFLPRLLGPSGAATVPTQALPPTQAATAPSSSTQAATASPSTPPVAATLTVGGQAVVHTTAGDRLRIHTQPDFNADVSARLADGTIVKIVEGPVTVGSDHWWRVQTADGQSGWAVDYVEGVQTLQPYTP